MEYRSLGRATFKVSCLAVGGNVFGQFCDARQTGEILSAAQHAGINLIDTADVYGEGLSERHIGRAIRHKRSDWVVATKLGVHGTASPRGMATEAVIIRRLNASLERLGTDYIDLYQLHHFDGATPLDETKGVLENLVRQGKIRAYGASNFTPENLGRFAEANPAWATGTFVAHQVGYNLFKREAEHAFAVCRQAGVGLLIYGALARGILSGKYRVDAPIPEGTRGNVSSSIRADLQSRVLERVAALESFARAVGKNLTQVALAWVLRWPEVSSVIVGVRSPAQLEDNLGAVGLSLSRSELDEMDRLLGDLSQYKDLGLGSFEQLVKQHA